MYKFYDTIWQEIPFSSFSKLSYFKLADSEFYEKFYNAFFKKYTSYEELSESWRKKKELQGAHIIEFIRKEALHSNILSIGCGMGYLEYKIIQSDLGSKINLYCQETSETSFKFLKKYISQSNCFCGFIPQCIPDDLKFNLIYLLTVDYALSNRQLTDMLSSLKGYLANDESSILISSLTIEEYKNISPYCYIKNQYNKLKDLFYHMKNESEKQFWGWFRTIDELIKICIKSGLLIKEYGSFANDIHNLYIRLGKN